MITIFKTMNLLLVEDDMQILENYKEILEYFFNNVYTADDEKGALKIFDKKNIDIVFTDYELKQSNGYELTKKLKQLEPNLSITIISSHDDREKLQKCIPLGLDGYLFKPIYYEDIKKHLISLSETITKNKNREVKLTKLYRINFQTRELFSQKDKFRLTKLETEFLELLVNNRKKVVSYEMIYEHLYEFDPSNNTIINLVYRLKKKYNIDTIKNIKDLGYIMVDEDE